MQPGICEEGEESHRDFHARPVLCLSCVTCMVPAVVQTPIRRLALNLTAVSFQPLCPELWVATFEMGPRTLHF
jgi:hypothetical protein